MCPVTNSIFSQQCWFRARREHLVVSSPRKKGLTRICVQQFGREKDVQRGPSVATKFSLRAISA